MINLSSEQNVILQLLRQTLWSEGSKLPSVVNWEVVNTIATEQGIGSFIYDGAVQCKADLPDELLMAWKDRMFRGAVRNELLLHAQNQLLSWFAQEGIPAVVLKGSSVARYYPQPELRVLGDIDILVKKADLEKATNILEQHGYTIHESDHEFHVGMSCRGVYVELHYHVTGFPDSEGGHVAQRCADHFLDEIDCGMVAGYEFPVLTEPNQALSLLLHMIRHMFSTGIGLRQVCDWAMYVSSVDEDCFTKDVIPLLANCGLLRYAKVATKACIRYLGVPDKNLSWCADVADEDCHAFIVEAFRLGNMGEAEHESMGSIFTNDDSMGKHDDSVRALLARLTEYSYKSFPFTRKYKVFLPVFWLYLPIRYWVRSMLGLRPKKSILKVVAAAQKQRSIYETLRPFEQEQ